MARAAAVSLWSREVPKYGLSPLSVELVPKEAKRLVDGHAEVLDVFLCHLAGAEIPKEAQV